MDESPRQLIRAVRLPLKGGRGKVEREDYEYERCGVCNVFMAVEPLVPVGLNHQKYAREVCISIFSLQKRNKKRVPKNPLFVYCGGERGS